MIRLSSFNIVWCLSFALTPLMALEITASTTRAVNDDQALKERFLREAPMRWMDYARLTKQLQGTYSYKISFQPVNVYAENTYTIKMNRTSKLIDLSKARKTPGGKGDYHILEIIAINPRYAFSLSRKTFSSPWVVTEVVDTQASGVPTSIQKPFVEFEDNIIALIKLAKDPLVDLVRKPEFRVARAKKALQAGEELVEIDFEYPHTVDERSSGVQGER